MSYDLETKFQIVLLAVHSLAFLALTGWFLTRTALGRWAVLGLVGAGLLGVCFGIPAAAWLEVVFLERHWITIEVLREHVRTVLSLGQALGAIVLAAAFVEHHRATAAPTPTGDALYGP